jgi:hypothetical protein
MIKLSETWRLLAVLLLSMLARLAIALPAVHSLNDPDRYLPLATSLANGQGFCLADGQPTAYRPPLYPLLLAPLIRGLGDRLPYGILGLHLALGLGTVALIYWTARRWGYSPNRATIAALISGLDPVAVVQAKSVMTETLAAFLVAATMAGFTLRGSRGVAVGAIMLALGSLCRPNLLPWAGLISMLWLLDMSQSWFVKMKKVLMFSLIVVIIHLPWAWRNYQVFGEPVFTTTHGGYTLALANNPTYYTDVLDGPPGTVWTGENQAKWFASVGVETFGMTQPQADRRMRDLGLKMIRDRPFDFARASVARLGRFWGVAPAGAVYGAVLRLATAAWTLPLWVALAIGLCRRSLWQMPQIAAPLVLITLTIVHTFYWTDMRMRVPAVPAIALIAAGMTFGLRKMGKEPRAEQEIVRQ